MGTMRCKRRNEIGATPNNEEFPDSWREKDNCCSYCGGLNPNEALSLIRKGKKVTPTDKNYKIYVDGMKNVYFQHFSDNNEKEFIEMYNDKTMKLEMPGHFYVLPYFMKISKVESN